MLTLAGPARGDAQETEPPDTYADAATRLIIEDARAARDRDVEGIESYEGLLRQRIYVGLTALRFRRERALFEHERIARIRWSADGDRVIQWLGVRTAIPIAGIDTGDPDGGGAALSVTDSSATIGAGDELARDMADDLLDETDMPAFDFDPGGDRLSFGGDDWALHPLSDTAAAHYRYAAGDTLRLSFPSDQPDIVLYEVLVEPRRADFRLVAASLWFDSDSGSLVRATYRPARPFNLEVDEPDDAADVPGLLKPITAEISYVTIDYTLQEFRYWLPRRFAFEGEARLASFARIPITFEWSVGGYLVNESETELLTTGDLPEGWQRQENVEEDEDGTETRVTVIVPTVEELRDSPELSQDFGERSPTSFTQAEVEELASDLEGLLPTYGRFRPQLAFGLQQGLVRFNRVEGLSIGTQVTIPVTPRLSVGTEARFGTADRELNVSGRLLVGPERSRWTLEGYHRLASWSDQGNPFSTVKSLSNVFLGSDRGEYYRATGAAAGYTWIGDRVNLSVGAFHERQRPVALESTFSVLGELSERTTVPVRTADSVDVTGTRMSMGWFRGIDPRGFILTGRMLAEVGWGDADYRRASVSASLSHPIFFGMAAALEVGGGTTWGAPPVQRTFLLGGSRTLRGFDSNQHLGPTFWQGRAEVGTGFTAGRVGLFTDLGWVGERASFRLDDPFVSVGVGASLLDGLLRLDLARGVRLGSQWKIHLYLDGLF
jgi:hypothetical protein